MFSKISKLIFSMFKNKTKTKTSRLFHKNKNEIEKENKKYCSFFM
jgi:hypothetical protein